MNLCSLKLKDLHKWCRHKFLHKQCCYKLENILMMRHQLFNSPECNNQLTAINISSTNFLNRMIWIWETPSIFMVIDYLSFTVSHIPRTLIKYFMVIDSLSFTVSHILRTLIKYFMVIDSLSFTVSYIPRTLIKYFMVIESSNVLLYHNNYCPPSISWCHRFF